MLSCLVYLHTEPRSAESYPRPLALFTPSFEGSLEGLPLSPLRPAVFFPNLQPSNAPFASRAGLRGLPTFQRSVSRPLPLRAPKSFRMHTYKSLSKQRTLISFRMIDLQKTGGGECAMVNQLPLVFSVPSCQQVPELSPSCSISYKLPIFYPICFDIHASDGGCGDPSVLSSLNVQTCRRSDVATFRPSDVPMSHRLPVPTTCILRTIGANLSLQQTGCGSPFLLFFCMG